MKRGMTCGLLATAGLAWAAFGAEAPAQIWFDETLSACRDSSATANQWVTTAGRWDRAAGDKSVCLTNERKVVLDTGETEVKYRPCKLGTSGTPSTTSLPSVADALTRVSVKSAVLTAFRGGEEWESVDKASLGGLSLRWRNDGSVTFIGWISTHDSSVIAGRWLELSAAGVEAAENVPYDILIESDNRCTPVRIRYSVNGVVLKDRLGNEWFSVRGGSLDPAAPKAKKVSSLCFVGRGEVGEIRGETVSAPTPRATVTLPRLKVQKAGAAVAVGDIVPLGDATVGTNLGYAWYLTDAAGKRVAERGNGANYTLTEADYGHWVSVDVTDESGFVGTGKLWFSNLPVVTIDCEDKKGWVVTEDEVAKDGVVYHWIDEDDQLHPVATTAGQDLAPLRAQYGALYLADVKTAWPTSKKEDHAARIHVSGAVIGDKEFKEQYASDGTLDGDEVIMSKLHVRGNSTAGQVKKPYKVKFGKKTDFFNLGDGTKNKHWVLLANYFDESLMRNKLSYDYSGEVGLVSMKSTWVDVVMNGQYVGNYQLCQHIRVASERIDIHDWSTDYEEIAKAAKKKSNPALSSDDQDEIETLLEEQQGWMTSGTFSYGGSNYMIRASGTPGWSAADNAFIVVYKDFSTDITGGYIYEFDWKKSGPRASVKAASSFAITNKFGNSTALILELAMNTPEFCFTNKDVSNEVYRTWADIADAWTSGTGYDAKGRHYTELCDFDSMVGYWLAQFVPGNNDAAGLSRYAYKDRGGKVFFGPAWDFDYGLGSLQIRERSATVTNEYGEATYAPIIPTGWIPGISAQNFMGIWTQDPYFMFRLRETYFAHRGYLADMVADGGLIDRYKDYLAASARANDLRWNNRIGFFGNAEERGDVDTLKAFLKERFEWLDKQFAASLGEAFPLLTKTVAVAAQRYVRTANVVPTFTDATTRPDTPETDIKDVLRAAGLSAIEVKVAVPTIGATGISVRVDDFPVGTFPVTSKKATVYFSASNLAARMRHLVSFTATDGSGKALANNVALLEVTLPETLEAGEGEGKAPVAVRIDWLDRAWTALAAMDEKIAEKAAPASYNEYLKFATGASPIGKATMPWQDFVADTDPSEKDDVFTALIEMGPDGLPVVKWSPDRSDKGGTVVRRYTLRGANDLATDPKSWDSLTVEGSDDKASEGFRRTHSFFTVEVALP